MQSITILHSSAALYNDLLPGVHGPQEEAVSLTCFQKEGMLLHYSAEKQMQLQGADYKIIYIHIYLRNIHILIYNICLRRYKVHFYGADL